MNLTHASILWLSICCTSMACGGELGGRHVGGVCEYQRIHGRATIADVRVADPSANNCRDAVEVVFTFLPDDPSAPLHYRFLNYPDTERHFLVGAGMNPPRKWARSKGLVKGAVHRCVRSEIVKGTCTPVTFTFPDLDMKGWEKVCYE